MNGENLNWHITPSHIYINNQRHSLRLQNILDFTLSVLHSEVFNSQPQQLASEMYCGDNVDVVRGATSACLLSQPSICLWPGLFPQICPSVITPFCLWSRGVPLPPSKCSGVRPACGTFSPSHNLAHLVVMGYGGFTQLSFEIQLEREVQVALHHVGEKKQRCLSGSRKGRETMTEQNIWVREKKCKEEEEIVLRRNGELRKQTESSIGFSILTCQLNTVLTEYSITHSQRGFFCAAKPKLCTSNVENPEVKR